MFVDIFFELLGLIEMLFQIHSRLLDHGHATVVSQVVLAGEFWFSDQADELLVPIFQPFEEEGFLEVPAFVLELEVFGLTGVSSFSGYMSSSLNS